MRKFLKQNHSLCYNNKKGATGDDIFRNNNFMYIVFYSVLSRHRNWRKEFEKLRLISERSAKTDKRNQRIQRKIQRAKQIYRIFSNLVLFLVLLFIMGLFIRKKIFIQNFLNLFILGQALNIFDLVFIDLIWWRNTKRIRLSKIPQKGLYQNPQKHIASFLRATIMYTAVAAFDGYLLTLF